MAVRLEADQHPPGVERVVGAVDADIGGQADHVRVGGQGLRQLLLQLRHVRIGDRLLGRGHALDQAGVLGREQALGDDQIEHHGQGQRGQGHQHGRPLAVQHPVQGLVIAGDDPVDEGLGPIAPAALAGLLVRAQPARGQGGRQGQGHHGRYDDGHRQGDGELAEQAADHVAHEQQRDQHRDQRHGQRDDGEADLRGALERGVERLLARLDIAGDVLQHDDGVVDHEAGGDGQGHQRQVVEAEAQQVHGREGADQ